MYNRKIPRANIIAPINVILPVAIPPNATPIAIPSGILWIVIAYNNNAFLFLLPLIILSKKLSDNKTNKPPITKPILGNNHSFFPNSLHKIIAGKIREKNDAANITPEEKPKTIVNILSFIFLKKHTDSAPSAVTNHVNVAANNAWIIGFKLENQYKKNTSLYSMFFSYSC